MIDVDDDKKRNRDGAMMILMQQRYQSFPLFLYTYVYTILGEQKR